MKRFEKYRNWIIAFVFAVAVIAVYKTFDNLYRIVGLAGAVIKSLSPFIIGFVIAYILNIPATKIENFCKNSKYAFVKKKSKSISIISVYLLLVLVAYITISAIAPALYRNVAELYNNIPNYLGYAMNELEILQNKYGLSIFEFNEESVMGAFDKLLGKFDIAEFGKYAKGFVGITSGVINIFIGIIVSVYMLTGKEKILNSLKNILGLLLKDEKSRKVLRVARKIDAIFSKYLFCLILDAVIMAVLATVILSILKVKYAIILGIMIGLFNLIPYFGAIFAATLSVIITLITGGLMQGIWTAVSLIILQQVDGNFIGPKIMGEVLDASPLWIILAVTLGGGFFGITGMIISVPVLVSIKMVVTDLIKEKEAEQSEG